MTTTTPWDEGREAARGDEFYTDGQSVSRSPNPYDPGWSRADPEKSAEWDRGYRGEPRTT